MKTLVSFIKYTFVARLGSIVVSFACAALAYSQCDIAPIFPNATSVATTAGYAGEPIAGGWRMIVIAPCIVSEIAGLVLSAAFLAFLVCKVAQFATVPFDRSI